VREWPGPPDWNYILLIRNPMDTAALQLLRTGLLVPLKVERETVAPDSRESAEFGFEVDLRFADEEDEDLVPEEAASWGSFGVQFLLARLAFAGA
jgi:hypothetical protein